MKDRPADRSRAARSGREPSSGKLENCSFGFLVDSLGTVDEVRQELPGAVLISGEAPDHGAVGDVGHRDDAAGTAQRLYQDLLGDIGGLLLRGPQETDGIGGG